MKMVFYAYFASLCQENGLLDLYVLVLYLVKSCEWKYFRRAVFQTKNKSLNFLIHFQILLMYFHFTGTIAQNLVTQCSSNLPVVLLKESWLDLNLDIWLDLKLDFCWLDVFMSWAQNLFIMCILGMNSQSMYMLTLNSHCLHF